MEDICTLYNEELLTYEEALVLFEEWKRQYVSLRLPRTLREGDFSLLAMIPGDVERNFRFSIQEIETLCLLLLPNGIRCLGRQVASPTTALCVFLRRNAYPCRWSDLCPLFRRNVGWLSTVYWETTTILYEWAGKLSENLVASETDIETFKEAIFSKTRGVVPFGAFGFLDGTWLRTCRPSVGQEALYSGYHSQHGITFQGVCCPDGLLRYFSRAYAGRLPDHSVFLRDGLEGKLGESGYVIGDSIYRRTDAVLPMWKRSQTVGMPDRILFNEVLASVRVSVEWSFGLTSRLFCGLQFWRDRARVRSQAAGMELCVAVFFTNLRVCMRGSQVSEYFGCMPPSVETFLDEIKNGE